VTRADWIFRPVLWFVTASVINVILHEGAHAAMAAALGLHPTLYQYWVNWPPGSATLAQETAIRAMGPAFSLIAGLCFWLAYRTRSRTAAGLPLLYLSTIGVALFFGSLASTAFAGDFSGAATWMALPMLVRYATSALGAAGAAAVLFWQGRELRAWIPDKAGRIFGVISVAVAPVLLGTAIIIVVNQPVPTGWSFVYARLGEAAFGVFTIAGAATGPRVSSVGRSFRLRWIDGTILLSALLVVRFMVFGIWV
jgi:hypothetical protein